MIRLLLAAAIFVPILTGWSSTPISGTTYYLSPSGSDANDGRTLGTPWLTPRHSVTCGDVILASSSTAYAAANFRTGQWGVVNCPAGNNVAWLKCAVFNTCKITINSTGHNAMAPTQSYWGIQGWEVSATTFSGNQCFNAYAPDFTHTVHHIIFANNVANGCGDGGITVGSSVIGGPASVGTDYVAIVGNIVYNAAQDNANCYSGIDIVPPTNSDYLPGTHIYIAGNYVWGNVDPNPCGGGTPSDGNGILVDTPDATLYQGQIVIENNIAIYNGGAGIRANVSTSGAPILIRYNTSFGNETGAINGFCGEIEDISSFTTQVWFNIAQTTATTACNGAKPYYGLYANAANATDLIFSNWVYSAAGNNTGNNAPSGFAYGVNLTGASANFTGPTTNPGAPNCSGLGTTSVCAASIAAHFTPTASGAGNYGFQPILATSTSNPLFPQWLCNVGLPAGLITMGCGVTYS